jgi:hypothetical protein
MGCDCCYTDRGRDALKRITTVHHQESLDWAHFHVPPVLSHAVQGLYVFTVVQGLTISQLTKGGGELRRIPPTVYFSLWTKLTMQILRQIHPIRFMSPVLLMLFILTCMVMRILLKVNKAKPRIVLDQILVSNISNFTSSFRINLPFPHSLTNSENLTVCTFNVRKL